MNPSVPANILAEFTNRRRALATAGATRAAQMPNTPTFGEAGFPEYDVGTTFGLLAAAGTPEAIVERVHSEFTGALRAP